MNLKPMLASLEKDVWDSPLHLYENKWNGLRIIGHCEGESVRLQGRSGADFTLQFPEVVQALKKAVKHPAVVDGEIVCLDERGLPSFNLIQNRIGKRDPALIRLMMGKSPAIYQVFDVTSVFNQDITAQGTEPATLVQRKDILGNLVTGNGAVKLSPWVDGKGRELFEKVKSLGQEGIMAKLKSSLYIPGGRGTGWLKMKVWKTGTFVIGGYTMGTGWRSDTLGALILGRWEGDKLRYVGNSGSGFTNQALEELYRALQGIKTTESPFLPGTKVEKVAAWVRPIIKVEIKYADVTRDGQLIWPIFQGIKGETASSEVQTGPLALYRKEGFNGLA